MVDPAQSLFLFLETLWQRLAFHKLHPGFDIRSYMSLPMNLVIEMGGTEAMPDDWYMAAKPHGEPGDAP